MNFEDFMKGLQNSLKSRIFVQNASKNFFEEKNNYIFEKRWGIFLFSVLYESEFVSRTSSQKKRVKTIFFNEKNHVWDYLGCFVTLCYPILCSERVKYLFDNLYKYLGNWVCLCRAITIFVRKIYFFFFWNDKIPLLWMYFFP